MFAETVYFLRKNSINLSTFFRERKRYPYSKMCELCELCELFVKKLLYKLSNFS